MGRLGAVDRHFDATRKLAGFHAVADRQVLLAADPFNRCRRLRRIECGIFLVEITRLDQMLGKQFLDMWRALERGDEVPSRPPTSARIDVGKAAARFFPGRRRRTGRRKRASYTRSITARNSASLDLK